MRELFAVMIAVLLLVGMVILVAPWVVYLFTGGFFDHIIGWVNGYWTWCDEVIKGLK
jgi:hypothetical protein